MSGVKTTYYVPGTNSQAWAKVEFQWPEGTLDEAGMEDALQHAVLRALKLMGERKQREDQATARVGSGEG